MDWQLQDAEHQLSEVLERAKTEGPQVVTLRGERAVVVLSARDYDALTAGKATLVDQLLSGPTWDDDLAAAVDARMSTPGRTVEF